MLRLSLSESNSEAVSPCQLDLLSRGTRGTSCLRHRDPRMKVSPTTDYRRLSTMEKVLSDSCGFVNLWPLNYLVSGLVPRDTVVTIPSQRRNDVIQQDPRHGRNQVIRKLPPLKSGIFYVSFSCNDLLRHEVYHRWMTRMRSSERSQHSRSPQWTDIMGTGTQMTKPQGSKSRRREYTMFPYHSSPHHPQFKLLRSLTEKLSTRTSMSFSRSSRGLSAQKDPDLSTGGRYHRQESQQGTRSTR